MPRRAALTGFALLRRRQERRAPFLAHEELERHQRRRVRRIIAHAHRHVPYYRETMHKRALTPADLTGAADLSKLPLIERDQIQRDPEYFMSEARSGPECLQTRSGGSTLTPITILEDPRGVVEKIACVNRVRPVVGELIGRRRRTRLLRIEPPHSSGALLARSYHRNLILPGDPRTLELHLSMQGTAMDWIEAMNGFKPHVVVSYGSIIEELFATAVRSKRPFHRPKVVAYGADALSPQARVLISEQLGIPVLSVYQAIESPMIGFECDRHAGHHLNVDLCPVRIIGEDGRDRPPGEPGEVVISNLVNHATVMLNYRLGDLAAIHREPCGCGRSLPMMSFVQGRTADSGVGTDGRPIHVQLLVRSFSLDRDLWGYRIEQQDRGRFHVQVLAAPDADQAAVTARVRERFAAIVGPDETVNLSFVDALPRTPAGKVRRVGEAAGT